MLKTQSWRESVYKLAQNSAPMAEVHEYEAQNISPYLGFVVFEFFLVRHPHILGCSAQLNQCLFFRQRRIGKAKIQGILMARRSYEQTYPQKLGREF